MTDLKTNIAADLRLLANHILALADRAASDVSANDIGRDDAALASQAARQLVLKGMRRVYKAADLSTGEDGWEILLSLFVKQVAGQGAMVTDATLALGRSGPVSTRWVAILAERGLVDHGAVHAGPLLTNQGCQLVRDVLGAQCETA